MIWPLKTAGMIKELSKARSEIGSEFWDIPLSTNENDIFPDNTKWFLAGRTALKYIIQDSGIKNIAMPMWCCDSMVEPFTSCGVNVEFYSQPKYFETDAVFVMDYFGYVDTGEKIGGYKGIVIRDLTHSIFTKKYDDADYYFGSLRKWAGFYTGGFAWGNWRHKTPIPPCDKEYVYARKQAMIEKEKYINGEIDSKDYLRMYEAANSLLKKAAICGAFEDDIYSARHFDVQFVKNRRRANARILLDTAHGLFSLGDNDCPLFVPIDIQERDSLRAYLIQNEVFCPVHWPRFDRNGKELSLVCDQRYDEKDMRRICNIIQQFYHDV